MKREQCCVRTNWYCFHITVSNYCTTDRGSEETVTGLSGEARPGVGKKAELSKETLSLLSSETLNGVSFGTYYFALLYQTLHFI